MALEKGTYLRLFRKIVDWEWYKDGNTLRLFIHLLIKANIKDKKFMGSVIKRGQTVTSLARLSSETGMSEQQIRTALKHLISTNEVTKMSTPRFTIITVNNYDKFQKPTNKLTNNQQAINKQLTNNQQQLNNSNNINTNVLINKEISVISTPTLSQIQNFVAENSLNVDAEKFFEYYSKRGWKTSKDKPIDDIGQLLFAWHKKEKNAYVSGYGKFRNEFTHEDYLQMLKEQQEEQNNAE